MHLKRPSKLGKDTLKPPKSSRVALRKTPPQPTSSGTLHTAIGPALIDHTIGPHLHIEHGQFVVRSKRLSNSSVRSSIESHSVNLGESSEKRPRMENTSNVPNESPSVNVGMANVPHESPSTNVGVENEGSVQIEMTISDRDIIGDPALRKSINDYDPRIRDVVRREYVVKGPCQPLSHDFPRTDISKKARCFQVVWFRQWDWLEYSVSEDAAYCFPCYLFRGDVGKRFGDDVFVITGFRNWKKASERFREHVGAPCSTHNKALTLFLAFKNQKQSVERKLVLGKQVLSEAYRTRLTASVDVVRLLLAQGLAFRGNDESATSLNKGNFLEVLDWYSLRNANVGKVVKENAPANHQLTSPRIQKEIIRACALETTKAIISDIGGKFFSLLIDEARDSSVKEQMAIVLRYVDNRGVVVERFLGVVHVEDTTALSLKSGVDDFFAKQRLSISRLRGQGYDGASNMRGELNGLKTLILNENPCARYIHCFAHQLQLVVVAVSQKNQFVSDCIQYMAMITNMVGASCKRKDQLRQKQHEKMVERLEKGEISTGRGLNQETSLVRPGATRWGSHHTTIVRLLAMWSSTIEVLENIFDDGADEKTRGIASSLVEKMETYEFVFIAHFMKLVLGLTNGLSQFLQQKDQNIIDAVSLVESTKWKLQDVRENGWDELLEVVNRFCAANDISMVNMEDNAPGRFRSRRAGRPITYYHHFRVEIFCQVIDQIGQEMENRFSESSTELLTCIGCLDPKDSFSKFSESKLLRLAELYPQDFSVCDRMELEEQLKMWICEVRRNEQFSNLRSIGDLAKKMVEVGFHTTFHLIYLLIELILVLPVATATVERVFSAMNIIKTDLRNKMGDGFLTDCLVCYIEKELFKSIADEVIIQHFQRMRTRRMDLPRLPEETP